ncbi:MAG: EamA family transporter [Alphaproteobacteria bacterium]|nr:EamA family transporter [Alphaproteobacteria bacterium]
MNQRTGEGRHGVLPVAAMGVTCLLWGTMVPFTAELFASVDPLFYSALRYLMGMGAMGFLVLMTERRFLQRARLPVLRVLALGGVGMAGWATLFALGIYFSDAITAAAVLASGPIVAALMGRAMTGEKLRLQVMLGIALAVAGGVLVAIGKPVDGAAAGFRGGEVILLVALCCWTWYSIKAQQWLAPLGLTQVRLTLWTISGGCVWLWAIYLAAWALGIAPTPRPFGAAAAWAMMVWVGFGGTGIAIWFWNYGASRLGTTIATVNLNLVPVIAVLTSTLLGHYPTMPQLAGGAVVIAGVLWVQFAPRRA